MGHLQFQFQETVVVITGGAQGIGRATVEEFSAASADVVLMDIDQERGSAVATGLDGVHYLKTDVTSPDSVATAFENVESHFGRVDVLVNNAGGFPTQHTVADLDMDEWQETVNLNLDATFIVSKHAIPLLMGSPTGRIINIGSLAAQVSSYRTSPAYAAAKAGVHALTRVLATELAPHGITVNAVAPSAVLTERITQLRSEDEIDQTARSIPLGRYQTPQEVASWIMFLASDQASFCTGQVLGLNGGRHMD